MTGARVEVARELLAGARQHFVDNVTGLTLDEALFAAGGHRSILGVLKHMGGWIHVYRSFAFDAAPVHWHDTSWPRGLRDTVVASSEYVREVIGWVEAGLAEWDRELAGVVDDELDRHHPLHWGSSAALGEIVEMVAREVTYHTGEVNMLLSIARGEAWEYTEEVEENHISTYGHGVRPDWMNDAQAARHLDTLRRRDDTTTARPTGDGSPPCRSTD